MASFTRVLAAYGSASMMAGPEVDQDLIEAILFGTDDARNLRNRTPFDVVDPGDQGAGRFGADPRTGEQHGWTLGFPLTEVELASIAGIEPGTAEKALSDLRKAGVVVGRGRHDVVVPDLGELRRFAGLHG